MMKSKILIILFILIVGFFGGRYFLLAPVNPRSDDLVKVEIPDGIGAKEIASRLTEASAIRSSYGFTFLAILRGVRGELKAGIYEISTKESTSDVLDRIVRGDTLPEDVGVTIPEGFTLSQIAERFSSQEIVEKESFISAAKVSRFKEGFSFLDDAPEEATLEGYLFPDTYRIDQEMTAEDVIRRMLTEFKEKYAAASNERGDVDVDSVHAIVTMASIVEREVKNYEDMQIVAGILWQRYEDGWGLDADATIRYAVDNWKDPLTDKELKIDSPYNTRKYRGLPLGPIGNPGLSSLRATLNPKKTDYRFYLSAPNGVTVFSSTLEEHNQAKREHLPKGEFSE